MDRKLRRLEAMMIAVDRDSLLVVSGTGDVIQPTDGVAAIGSGGRYALAAARALMAHSDLSAAADRPRRPGDRRPTCASTPIGILKWKKCRSVSRQ